MTAEPPFALCGPFARFSSSVASMTQVILSTTDDHQSALLGGRCGSGIIIAYIRYMMYLVVFFKRTAVISGDEGGIGNEKPL